MYLTMKIKAIITGATGMVGQGVLRECIHNPEVESVLVLTRSPTGIQHEKLRELVRSDFYDWSDVQPLLKGYNACLFCLGTSAVGMSEKQYTHITYSLTILLAAALRDANPDMAFVYVSGMGTDSSEQGRSMWARVKGKTENAILQMGFRDAYAFRPGIIIPEHGIRSRTPLYSLMYTVLRPFYPLLKTLDSVTTTTRLAQAMLRVVTHGTPDKHLENKAINHLAKYANA